MRWLERIALGFGALRGLLRGRRKTGDGEEGRIVPAGDPDRRAETVVILLLFAAALCAVGFMVVYSFEGHYNHTQLLGIALGLSLALIGIALVVIAKRLIVTEEIEEEYPEPEHLEEQVKVVQVVHESTSRFTRKRLLAAAGGAAAGALGLAALTPVLSFGPAFHTAVFYETPWRRGRRLVDKEGRPYLADDIEEDTFYTAYAEGVPHDDLGSPLVVIRLALDQLKLPPARRTWAPNGILAYSKVCTHAGCAIALYRTPLFQPVEAAPALVCPCHYSTFNPATGGDVIFGPAGRDLPQLPLMVDDRGELRAAGNMSAPVGPSWFGVRQHKPI
jgi:ubiquinol-cytochrome c reductase iron-sulfur subunit